MCGHGFRYCRSTKHARVHSRLECLLLHCVPSTFVQHVTPRREHLVDPAIESPLLIPPMVGVFAVSFFFSIHHLPPSTGTTIRVYFSHLQSPRSQVQPLQKSPGDHSNPLPSSAANSVMA
jgi:hypothetical protein